MTWLCVGEQGFSVVQTLPVEWLFFVLVTLYWRFKCPTLSYILIGLLSNEINLKVSCSRRQWHHNWQMVIKSFNLLINVCADRDIDVIAPRQTDSNKLSGSTCVSRISAWQGMGKDFLGINIFCSTENVSTSPNTKELPWWLNVTCLSQQWCACLPSRGM